ncbi:MAG: endonuclease/exonuclease/phosphatase family protein [Acidimicrobiia bacterium]
MTANVLEDGVDLADLGDLIERVDPHLVFLQEMTEGAAGVLADRFEHHFLFPSEDYEGRGVASKFEAECGSIPLPWRPGSWARVVVEGKTLVGAGVHMSNPIQFPPWRSIRERRDQVDALLAWVDRQDADAMIVAGDMNATPIWPVYRQLADRWVDLAVEGARSAGREPEPTWGWRPGWPRMLRIDHMFGSGVTAVASQVEPIRGSDHHALIVDFTIG